jgi:RES domain-containing protein
LKVWRIARRAYADTALSGYGAAQRGGRWNSRGTPVVYAAQHQSLALLELLVHANKQQLPDDLIFTGIDVPDDAIRDVDSLPEGWNAIPHISASQTVGDKWIAGRASVGLRVPSVIVPTEHNVLLNPLHPQFATITSIEIIDVLIDTRLI